MRACALTLLVIALLVAGCQDTTTPPIVTVAPAATASIRPPTVADIPWSDRSVFAASLEESYLSLLEGLPGASVYHLDLTLAPDLSSVRGAQEVLYTNTETHALEEIALHLFPNLLGGEMVLTSVRVDGTEAAPSYGEGDGSIRIPLASPLDPGDSVVIGTDFEVRVPSDLTLNYGVLAASSGVLAYAHGYPMVAVYDEDGWNLAVPAPYGDITYADASFYLVRVHAPADVVLCSSGVEISRTEADGQQEVLLAIGPARDFYLAGSRAYQVFTRSSGDTTLRACAPQEMRERAELALDYADRGLQLFNVLYAKYPYAKLDVIATPNMALGIEYPGAFALNQLLLTPEDDLGGSTPEEVLLEPVTVHEAAHEWFYNLVGNDQLEDPWLDEGLAQYATLRYFTKQYGEGGGSGMRSSFYGRWDRVDREPIPIGLPVADYSDVAYGAIVYGRGPLFFEALEERMGAEPFDAFLRQYTATYSWEEATPEGLRQLAEAGCGCDLGDLFAEWVY